MGNTQGKQYIDYDNMLQVKDKLWEAIGRKQYIVNNQSTYNYNVEIETKHRNKKWGIVVEPSYSYHTETRFNWTQYNNDLAEADGTTALQMAIVNNHLPTVKFLLEDGKADINKTNKDGVSPLYYSLGYFHQAYKLEITKFLLEHNANVHIKSISGGDQPLHRASNLADVTAIKLLLQHGASINEMNKDGSTPLHFLLDGQNTKESSKKLDAIKYLLAKSASITLKDKEEHDAIDLAKSNFPEALPWLEHPENLPSLSELETSIIGLNDFMV